MNNLYLAKVNVVNPYSIEYLGGMNTCISSFNSYMTVVYKSDDKFIDLFNKERVFDSNDYICGVERYEIEAIEPLSNVIKRKLVRKR